jgi:hypothetical protein
MLNCNEVIYIKSFCLLTVSPDIREIGALYLKKLVDYTYFSHFQAAAYSLRLMRILLPIFYIK